MIDPAFRRAAAAATIALVAVGGAHAQQAGSISGRILDADFQVPLALVEVTITETGETATATIDGAFGFPQVPSGVYTLIFRKDGYAPVTRGNVAVQGGRLTEVTVEMAGDITDLPEFVVQDLQVGGSTEIGLLNLRMSTPELVDSVSSELLSAAGASDAAAAITLVAGTTVQDGKFAVIRGLPDRFVSSQINSVRLPTADEDKRAVQLDQFPAAAIESVRVTKTFLPDQQGDASGGAVNIVLKGIPDQAIVEFKASYGYNDQVSERQDFITYQGGGVNLLGDDRGGRDEPVTDEEIAALPDAVGTFRTDAPIDYKTSFAAGASHDFGNGIKVGAFGSFFYERDSSFHDNGEENAYWVEDLEEGMVPEKKQQDGADKFVTSLFDVTRGTEAVQWGGLFTTGLESEYLKLDLTYLYTRVAEDSAILAEDTRGKAYFFEDYDPDDPFHPGNDRATGADDTAPYLRTQTLDYTERTTETLIVGGRHTLPQDVVREDEWIFFKAPVLDWSYSQGTARLYQPDKRQFGVKWIAPYYFPGFPFPPVPPAIRDPAYEGLKPAANFNLGNLQRIFKEITEKSEQYAANLELPFEQWNGDEGSFKIGLFDDEVVREFDQNTYSNGGSNPRITGLGFDEFWSGRFVFEDETLTESTVDVDYRGDQKVSAWYAMLDMPVAPGLRIIGGARSERTRIGIRNFAEADAFWYPINSETPGSPTRIDPAEVDVDYEQDDVLPAISAIWTPVEDWSFRAAYSETVARQTFKELTPVIQQEFLGGPIFIGNPELTMAALRNYDLRADWTPYEGGLVSVSYFQKKVFDAIEFVQDEGVGFSFTTPVNYPQGRIEGFELEVRQDVGRFFAPLEGLTVGGNATFIDSEVRLPREVSEEIAELGVVVTERDMTNAPDILYNLYFTYDIEATGTSVSLFYTVRGDTLVAGAGVSSSSFVPDVYETEYETLNLTVKQKIGDYLTLSFSAKNLTDPEIQSVYRAPFLETSELVRSTFTRGVDLSLGLTASFTF